MNLSPGWIEDCMQTYGRVLVGEYSHWCIEWDGLPIDESCQEFEACLCCLDKVKS